MFYQHGFRIFDAASCSKRLKVLFSPGLIFHDFVVNFPREQLLFEREKQIFMK